jgi:hypothetical protein
VATQKKGNCGLFMKKNIVTKFFPEETQREVFPDELKRIIERSGRTVPLLQNKVALVDGERSFIRPGSDKQKGWQITFRGSHPESFFQPLIRGEGNLLVNRNGVLLIPLSIIQQVVDDPAGYEQNPIDVYICFYEDKVYLKYKQNRIDVTQYKIT